MCGMKKGKDIKISSEQDWYVVSKWAIHLFVITDITCFLGKGARTTRSEHDY
jgi:hypothetical protein